MLWIRRLLLRFETLFRRHQSAERLNDEMQFLFKNLNGS